MSWLGVDGCRGGWLAVAFDGVRAELHFLHAIDEAAAFGADRILVDMPIGLPGSGRRSCDLAARRMLGAARSRIFLDARRPLLAETDYAAANARTKRDGYGISKQLWSILAKIGEVDRFVTPAMQERVLEAHPELAFQRMNGGAALPNKKTRDGEARRRALLSAAGLAVDALVAGKPRMANVDDVLDAAALALAAGAPARVPSEPARDARGLKIEIWY